MSNYVETFRNLQSDPVNCSGLNKTTVQYFDELLQTSNGYVVAFNDAPQGKQLLSRLVATEKLWKDFSQDVTTKQNSINASEKKKNIFCKPLERQS